MPPEPSSPQRRPTAGWLATWLLAGASALLGVVVLEVGLRLVEPPPAGTPFWTDFRTLVTNRTAPKGSYVRVPDLGWTLRPGLSFEMDGCRHDVDALGYRVNDNALDPGAEPTVLAVGDSFTFGHRLDNRETWPSALERELGLRVVNAGVSGYGLDQMLVQARRSLDAFPHTRTVIVAIISDDVDRIRFTVRAGIAKPWFRIDAREALELVPADHAAAPGEDEADPVKRILGHSYVAHRTLRHAFPAWWNEGTWNDYREADIDVAEVGRRITDALVAEVAGEYAKDLVFLLLPASPTDMALATPAPDSAAHAVAARAAAAAARHPRVFVADLQTELARRFPDETERQRLYHDASVDPAGHFNARGAALVASIVASFFDRQGSVIEEEALRYRLR
jgi:hypothetical protein